MPSIRCMCLCTRTHTRTNHRQVKKLQGIEIFVSMHASVYTCMHIDVPVHRHWLLVWVHVNACGACFYKKRGCDSSMCTSGLGLAFYDMLCSKGNWDRDGMGYGALLRHSFHRPLVRISIIKDLLTMLAWPLRLRHLCKLQGNLYLPRLYHCTGHDSCRKVKNILPSSVGLTNVQPHSNTSLKMQSKDNQENQFGGYMRSKKLTPLRVCKCIAKTAWPRLESHTWRERHATITEVCSANLWHSKPHRAHEVYN